MKKILNNFEVSIPCLIFGKEMRFQFAKISLFICQIDAGRKKNCWSKAVVVKRIHLLSFMKNLVNRKEILKKKFNL